MHFHTSTLQLAAAMLLLGSTQQLSAQSAKHAHHPLAFGGALAEHASTDPWSKDIVYAALTSRGVVNVYRDGRKPHKTPFFSFGLNPGTEGSLIVDRKRNLYFADPFSTWVFEYAPGASTPTKSFPTQYTPWSIAVRGDTLYAFQSMPSGGSASIAIYENGSTSPTRSLSDPAITYPQGIAVDADGNVFVGYGGVDIEQYGIGEFVKGKMPMKVLSTAYFASTMAIDPAGNLLVDCPDDTGGSTIYAFPPGETAPGWTIPNLPTMYQFSITADGQSMFVGPTFGKKFAKYTFPGGQLLYRVKDDDAYVGFSGVAASPAAKIGVW